MSYRGTGPCAGHKGVLPALKGWRQTKHVKVETAAKGVPADN